MPSPCATGGPSSTPARSAPPWSCPHRRGCSRTAGSRPGSAWFVPPPASPWPRRSLPPRTGRMRTGISWRALWDAEIEGLPSHTESRLWLVTGLLLPIWDRLPGENMRVRRLATDAGESLLGRVLTPEQAHAFRDAFGLSGGPVMSSAEIHEAILNRGASFDLANGWRLARRRLMGAGRVEDRGAGRRRPCGAQAHGGAPPRSSRGGPVCSCPNTSTSAASSNAGRSRLRTRCKPARSRPGIRRGASERLLPPATRASGDLRLCAAHCRQLHYLP